MENRYKKLLLILLGALVLLAGAYQTSKKPSKDQQLQSREDTMKTPKRSSGEYRTDILKKSLGE